MASFNKFQRFVEDEAEGVHNLGADTLRVFLSNTLPVAGSGLRANWVEIAAGNGYAAGGPAISITSSAQAAGTYRLIGSDLVITATGGPIGPFRYVIIYNDTPTSPADPGIGWYDYGEEITLAAGEEFTVDFDQALGLISKV